MGYGDDDIGWDEPAPPEPPEHPPPRRRGRPDRAGRSDGEGKRPWAAWQLALLGCGAVAALLVLFVCGGLVWLGTVATPTYVTRSRGEIRKFRPQMRELTDLEPGENVRWFYSWGLKDCSEGFVALTDEALLVYYGVELWDEEGEGEAHRVDFREVAGIDFVPGKFLDDGICTVYLTDGMVHEFLLSAEKGNGKRFVADLRKAVEAAGGDPDPPPPGGY